MSKALALTGALIVVGAAVVASNKETRDFILGAVESTERASRRIAHKAKSLSSELGEAFVESGSPREFINSAKVVLTQSR